MAGKFTLSVAMLLGVSVAAVGLRAQQIDLQVVGSDEDIEDSLRDASLILSLDDEGPQSAQDYVAAARADYRRMLAALYSEGHYGGKVSIMLDGREAAQIPLLDAPSHLDRIKISVDPGPLFTFGAARVAPLPPDTELPEEFAPGEPALAGAVRAATKAGTEAWRSYGHAKVEVARDEITARHPERKLDARVALSAGPRLSFGPLIVTGNENVRSERIRAIAGLPEGEVFDPEIVELAATRLRRTGAFRSVSLIEAEGYSADLRLPIRALVEERKPRRIGAGLEYSSLDGITASAYWMHRNLLGGAENFRIDGKVAQIGSDTEDMDYAFGVTFERPATFGPENTLTAHADLSYTQDPGYTLSQLELGLGMTRIVDQDFTISIGAGLVAGRVEDDLGEREYVLLTLPIESALDKRDIASNPTRGYYLDAEVTPFVGLSGSESGARLEGEARGYYTLPIERQVTLAGRLQLGSLIGPQAKDAPADYLFFSGGGDTVRGHSYQSLGQTLPGGGTIGGRSFAGLSAEARAQVRGPIGAVVFADYGYISDDPMPGRDGKAHAGAGIGVRYNTRLGPIRLDVATPVGHGETGDDVQFYIGIGQAF